MFGVWCVLLGIVLYALYRDPAFGERASPLLLTGLSLASAGATWLGSSSICRPSRKIDTGWGFFLLARYFVRPETAWIGVLLLAASSFFLLNSGAFFPHALTGLCGVMFALFGVRYQRDGQAWCAAAAGVCIGVMGVTRTANAAIFIVPFVVSLGLMRDRRIGLLWFGLAGTPFLLLFLQFNALVTANPFVSVQSWQYAEPIGAPSPRTVRLSASLLNRLFLWTSPVLVVGFVAAFLAALRRRQLSFCDWIMPVTIVVFFFYGGDGGNQYGPRYYYEAWFFGLLTILKLVDPIVFTEGRERVRGVVASAVIASLLLEIAYVPARLVREHRVVTERQDVYAQAKSARLSNALVIIVGNSGVIRPMPPVDLVRNGLSIGDQPVIYARDADRAALRSQFPLRQFYTYDKGQLRIAP